MPHPLSAPSHELDWVRFCVQLAPGYAVREGKTAVNLIQLTREHPPMIGLFAFRRVKAGMTENMDALNGFFHRFHRAKLNPSQVLVTGFAAVIIIGAILLSLPAASANGKASGLLTPFSPLHPPLALQASWCSIQPHLFAFWQIVIITLIQIGGLGFMALATAIALFLGRKITLRGRILLQESLNQFSIAGWCASPDTSS